MTQRSHRRTVPSHQEGPRLPNRVTPAAQSSIHPARSAASRSATRQGHLDPEARGWCTLAGVGSSRRGPARKRT